MQAARHWEKTFARIDDVFLHEWRPNRCRIEMFNLWRATPIAGELFVLRCNVLPALSRVMDETTANVSILSTTELPVFTSPDPCCSQSTQSIARAMWSVCRTQYSTGQFYGSSRYHLPQASDFLSRQLFVARQARGNGGTFGFMSTETIDGPLIDLEMDCSARFDLRHFLFCLFSLYLILWLVKQK